MTDSIKVPRLFVLEVFVIMSCEQRLLEQDPVPDPDANTSELEKSAFNRIITSIHDFIMLLKDIYVPEDAVMVPPEGGWPEITKKSWSNLGKSDEVIEVLRHPTYIEGDDYEEKY